MSTSISTEPLVVEPPRPATADERAAILPLAVAHDLERFIPGEPEPTETDRLEAENYYATAQMMIYPVRRGAVRLCVVSDPVLSVYENLLGWNQQVWLGNASGEWRRLDLFDSQLLPSDILPPDQS